MWTFEGTGTIKHGLYLCIRMRDVGIEDEGSSLYLSMHAYGSQVVEWNRSHYSQSKESCVVGF